MIRRIPVAKHIYLELTCPDMCGRIIHERPREVALDTTDEVVILGMRPFPEICIGRRMSTVDSEMVKTTTHEIIPKAWYSMIVERDIRAMRPCCIPLSNRRIATFGDGCRRRREDGRSLRRYTNFV